MINGPLDVKEASMVTQQMIEDQLEKIDFSLHGWNKSEIEELKNIILPDEKISECVNGFYEGGFALLVATDIRVILVDKKPLNFLSVEDLRFDMINEIDYNHRAFGAGITITTGSKALKFTSYNKQRLRKLIGHVQHCMANTKKTQADSQAGQHQHLEQINQQLQAYLVAQYKQQQKLQDYLGELQKGNTNTVPPVQLEKAEMSRQLKDYLFANGLLEKYAEESVSDPASFIQEQQAMSQVSSTPAPQQQAPPDPQLDDLYADGMREVFGKSNSHKLSGKLAAVQDVSISKLSGSFDFSPLKAVYRILPSAIGRRRFGPIGAKSLPAAE